MSEDKHEVPNSYDGFEYVVINAYLTKDRPWSYAEWRNMTPREFWNGPGATIDLEALADRRKPLPADIPLEALTGFMAGLFNEMYEHRYGHILEPLDMSIADDRLALMEADYPGIAAWYRKRVEESKVLG